MAVGTCFRSENFKKALADDLKLSVHALGQRKEDVVKSLASKIDLAENLKVARLVICACT